MTIKSRDFIFLDFQTTGTVAAQSDIIEAGYGLYRAENSPEEQDFHIHLIALEGERQLSKTIQKLTGLSAEYYRDAPSIAAEVLKERLTDFLNEHKSLPILVHYAQFKVPFLKKVLGESEEIVSRIICVHKLAKRLLPGLKSYSLRAVAGYLGYATAEKKRSLDHLRATAKIWQNLSEQITETELPNDLVSWLSQYSPIEDQTAKLAIHDETLRKKRLSLPHEPGVYFFLDRYENILYVGKALDLHHRVNSYFRGRKTKGSRLNEMLTRAEDFRFLTVTNELEALLRENDEIKKNDPPYNRLLRAEGRSVQTIRFNDFLPIPRSWGFKPYGPLSSLWMIEALQPFIQGEGLHPFLPGFLQGITETMIQNALLNLFASYGLELSEAPRADDWYQLALKAWPLEYARLLEKQTLRPENVFAIEEDEENEVEIEEELEETERVWTEEDVEAFLRDAFLHLYRQILRSRWYLRLVDSFIEWEFHHSPGIVYPITIRAGEIDFSPRALPHDSVSFEQRLGAFDMQVYDRIGILYSEIKKGLKRGDRIRLHLGPHLVLDTEDLERRVRP